MEPITYTLTGRCPSKKNQKRIVRNKYTGKTMILSSSDYESWHREAFLQLLQQGIQLIKVPVAITVEFTVGARTKFDLSNKFESVADLLVDCGILQDDNYTCMPQVNLQYMGYSKDVWETKITLVMV